MDPQRTRQQTQDESGFTIVELLVVSVLALVVVMSSYQLLISQSQLLAVQGEMIDARDSSHGAAILLASELRSAAASDDLYVIAQDSVVLRSFQATGVMCAWDSVGIFHRLGLQNVSGTFPGTVEDSAKAYSITDQSWAAFDVTEAWNGALAWSAGGTPVCFWGDSTTAAPRPEAAIELTGTAASLATLGVGASVRIFRRTKYGLFAQDGRWWLGRRVAAGAWELLTGPMLSPANGGLTFAYYDVNDAVTTDPTLVSRVEFTIRSESYGQVSGPGGGTVGDSLTTTVFLRNN